MRQLSFFCCFNRLGVCECVAEEGSIAGMQPKPERLKDFFCLLSPRWLLRSVRVLFLAEGWTGQQAEAVRCHVHRSADRWIDYRRPCCYRSGRRSLPE